MKTSTRLNNRLFAATAFAALTVALLMVTACEKCDQDDPSSPSAEPSGDRPITKNNLVLPFFVEGANQEWWNNLQQTDVLFEERGHNPILAPDGHQVTWAEFNRAAGTAKINCTGQGTRLNINIEGLIPNGVYSLFMMKFDAPGFDTAYTNLSGLGAVGGKDGIVNNFTASSTGEARLHITNPEGPMSVSGTVAKCIPEDEFEIHFVGMYHIDGQSYGPSPGPAGTYVENFAFIVLNH